MMATMVSASLIRETNYQANSGNISFRDVDCAILLIYICSLFPLFGFLCVPFMSVGKFCYVS